MEKQDSMGLLEANVCRNSGPMPSPCTVRVPSSPSSRLRAALGLMRSLPEDFPEFRFGFRVAGHRVGVADSAIRIAPAALRQMFFHVPPLVNLAALHVRPLAEHSLDPRAQR